ncbi:MAG: DUF4129 domain-containing protein [Thermoplasmata archaeon]|nr:DUF4129 domain-containing protein [Thermoplasmata archaeon]
MVRRKSRPRPSLLLLVLLLCALAVGAAVSLISSARTAGPPPPVGPTSEIVFPPWVVSVAIVGFTLALVLPIIYARLRTSGGGPLTRPFMLGGLSLLLAGVVVVALFHLLGGRGGGFQTVAGNNSNLSSGGSNNSSSFNATPVHGPGGVLAPFNFQFPSWTLFALVSVAAVAVVLAGLPPLAEYLEDRREDRRFRARSAQVAAQVQKALRDAARDLENAFDPRETILALYATLLSRIEPLSSNLDRSTPEEIRHLHLTRLGIRADAARDLTRVFEEARYSSHPLGRAQVVLASTAIKAAEEDLLRSGETG